MQNNSNLSDQHDLCITSSNAVAVEFLDNAVAGYLGLRSDVGMHLKAMFDADPDIVMGHILKGYFYKLFANPVLDDKTEHAIKTAETSASKRGANSRELQHIAALKEWQEGKLLGAVHIWEDILKEYPLDVVALRLAYHTYFYVGDVSNGRDLLGRVMHAWADGIPCYGFVLGQYAFALEEAGDYVAAEKFGRLAVERNAGDIWAVHSVCHVMEMQGRHKEGIAWVESTEPGWRNCNNFRYHIWWHQALFYYETAQHDEILNLYDTEVRADKSNEYLDICNAASLLWRLEMRGLSVGERWEELAEFAEDRVNDHVLAFVDAHFIMALSGGQRVLVVEEMLHSLDTFSMDEEKTQARIIREVGLPLCKALVAYREGNYGLAFDLLFPIRYKLLALGGSHAQRDLFVETLISAALKSERFLSARSLLSERVELKPRSRASWNLLAMAQEGLGEKNGSRAAKVRAAALEI